jgi:signal transduction histidine kinase
VVAAKLYEGRREGYFVALAGLAAIAVITWVDSAAYDVTIGALLAVPVLAAAWLLDRRLVVLITLAAILTRVYEAALGTIPVLTAVAQSAALTVVASLSHVAAEGQREIRRTLDQQRQVRDLSFLVDTSQEITASLDRDRILRASTEAVGRIIHHRGRSTQARAAFHELVEGDRLRIATDYDETGAHYAAGDYPINWNKAAVRAIRHGRLELVRGTDLADPLRALAEKEGWRAGALVPVRATGKLQGLLIATARDRDQFEEDDLHLIEVVGQMTGLALGHADTFERERDEAERATALERTKSEFLRLASHEMRGPLTVVRGYLSMILDGSVGSLDASTRRMLGTVDAKVNEMETLITQMLEAARLEDSSLMLRMERFDLADAIAEAIVRSTPAGEQGRVHFERPEQQLLVTADRERVLIIVGNLVSNAVKYSPNGQPVTVTSATADGSVVTRVIDRGIGIAASDQPFLFTRFGRVVPAEHQAIAGTGLGLYLSRELARLLAGDVTLESELGKGSTFTFTLPLAA